MGDNQVLEKTLWQAADKLRNNMDAAEYKHIVLGLIGRFVSNSQNGIWIASISRVAQSDWVSTDAGFHHLEQHLA